ncbi:hypothetical protein MPTK1_2g04780 [Marchantia polymorpha subsp. ruderalis]|uniref:Uncharacterized protein n=1 Tax=Marchantia polymorpha TaxID=3197 RepID=A0A2R6X7T6_MARPO|nr:hypothetical protein MARPO_0031s0133 [Marchantia polymorpha]BBN01117.1 hypothetical protein Mp_2g04780 [Marchantia polymorpha subsp. ruderalis]|eukprot:PTQ42166.1 hypothetical protein MARPO_0031s0133 [Marchantia polymorpha]
MRSMGESCLFLLCLDHRSSIHPAHITSNAISRWGLRSPPQHWKCFLDQRGRKCTLLRRGFPISLKLPEWLGRGRVWELPAGFQARAFCLTLPRCLNLIRSCRVGNRSPLSARPALARSALFLLHAAPMWRIFNYIVHIVKDTPTSPRHPSTCFTERCAMVDSRCSGSPELTLSPVLRCSCNQRMGITYSLFLSHKTCSFHTVQDRYESNVSAIISTMIYRGLSLKRKQRSFTSHGQGDGQS